ncbi:retrovirus-related pol polyprotein from transposon TNT 1-94 [Tanacetum coccineum]
MADKGKKSSMETFSPNDIADYYSGITSIIVNGKNAYELKGKFLDDLHNNAFSGTNGKDAVEHIEYYLKIIDPIKLPNVDHDKPRVVVFPISLVGGAHRWFDRTKESITCWVNLTAKFFGKYYPPSRIEGNNTPKMGGDEIEVSDDESSDLEKHWRDKEEETAKNFKIETDVFDYETPLCLAFNEFNCLLKVDPDYLQRILWGLKPMMITKTIGSTNGTRMYHGWREDGYCNRGNFPGAYHIENSLDYQELEWYEALEDSELKDEALRNKAIMEGLISDDESCNDYWKRWESHEINYHDYDKGDYENETHEEVHELCGIKTHEVPVCQIKRYEMIKYSFNDEEEYVAVKEDSLHPKWRAKVTAIEESKDLASLSLDELIGNLKVYEMIIKKDFEISQAKVWKDMPGRRCFRCGDPNHLIGECPKPPRDKNRRAFVEGSWSDSGEDDDEKVNNEACLVAQAPNKVCSESSYFSDENSSIDDLALDNEYDKLCKMSLKIITKNKRLKATRNSLEKEIRELKDKLSTLKKNKGVDLECTICQSLKIENGKLKEEALKLTKFEKSTHCLNEMLSNQKPSGDKLGLGFNSFEASSSGTKEIKFVKAQKKASSDGGPINMGGPQNKICLGVDLEPDEWIKDSGCSKHMMGNRKLFSTYKSYNGGNVIFCSNLRGNIIGKGQICDNKCRVNFSEYDSEITKGGRVIGHTNMRLIQSLASKELVRNLPKLKFDQHFCDACKIRKQAHASHTAKNIVSTTRCLELLYMDLFGPFAIWSYRGNRYTLVIVDDYSRLRQNSKAYIILNKLTRKIKRKKKNHSNPLNVTFDESPPPYKTSPLVDDDLDEEEAIRATEKKNLENVVEDETLEINEIVNIKESRNHPLENIIGNLNQRTLRLQAQNQSNFFCFISTIEPKNVNKALGDESWIVAMQEELNQFIANDVWELVPQPKNMTIIGTKWVLLDMRKRLGHPLYFTVYYSSVF